MPTTLAGDEPSALNHVGVCAWFHNAFECYATRRRFMVNALRLARRRLTQPSLKTTVITRREQKKQARNTTKTECR